MYPIIEELVRDKHARLEGEAAAERLAATATRRPRRRHPVRPRSLFSEYGQPLGGYGRLIGHDDDNRQMDRRSVSGSGVDRSLQRER
jgi:hypothetical protein